MGNQHDQDQRAIEEQRTFAEARAVDVHDERAMRFWADRLGVSCAELCQVVKEVGPNLTAVALKIEAPNGDRMAPPANPSL